MSDEKQFPSTRADWILVTLLVVFGPGVAAFSLALGFRLASYLP